jgi:hypothetical protein
MRIDTLFRVAVLVAVLGLSACATNAPPGPSPPAEVMCSNASLRGTYVGTTAGFVPASLIGGDPKASVPILMGFVYTFDGNGHISGYGQPSIDGNAEHDPRNPLGMLKCTGTYQIDPATCSGTEEVVVSVPSHDTTFHRWFSLSDNNTRQHFVTVDPGFRFEGVLSKR